MKDAARTRFARALRPARYATVALAIAGIAVSSRSAAYCRTTNCPKCDPDANQCPGGTPIAWPTSCLTFSMHYAASKKVDLATATSVMEKAFAAWTQASCPGSDSPPSITIDHHFGEAACELHEYNLTDGNANIILFRDDVWPYEAASNVLGLTTVTFKGSVVLDVDMEINTTQRISVGDPVPAMNYDLQSIVTHEAGHFFGMGHSNDPAATMRAQYSSGMDSFRSLAPDDIAGICSIYPPDQAAQCNSTPKQGFSTLCRIFPSGNGGACSLAEIPSARSTRRGAPWLALSTMTMAIWLARRRARRL